MHAFFRSHAVSLLIASVFLSVAISVNLFVSARPVQSAAAGYADIQISEQDQIDAYIQSRM